MTEDDLARENISNRIMLYCEPILSTTMVEAYIYHTKEACFLLLRLTSKLYLPILDLLERT
jgi:hypothetical protein